jgi:phosphatidylglycerol---prolipoprotein diacylglyceryl transferase
MFPILHIGPLAIQSPGLILVVGLWLSFYITAKEVKYLGIPTSNFENVFFISIFIGLVGARLFYLFQYPDILFANLLSIFSLNMTMIHPGAGVFCAGVAYLAMFQKNKISLWAAMDALALTISIEIPAIFFSLFASGEWYGIPTTFPWGIWLWGEHRHPTQLYGLISAAIVAVLLFLRILPFIKRNYSHLQGGIFLAFGMLTSVYFILIDRFVANGSLLLDTVHVIQVAGWNIFFFCSLYFQKKILPNLMDIDQEVETRNGS